MDNPFSVTSVDEELDRLEEAINKIGDEQIKSGFLRELVSCKEQLTMISKNGKVDLPLMQRITALQVELESYQSGNPVDVEKLGTQKYSIEISLEVNDAKARMFREKRELYLAQYLLEASHISDEGDIQKRMETVEEKLATYQQGDKYLPELEDKLAEIKYALMLELLKKGDIELAMQYMETFNSQMGVIISRKAPALYEKIKNEVITEKTLGARTTLFHYLYDNQGDAKSIELWKALLVAEDPDFDLGKFPKIEEKKEPVVLHQPREEYTEGKKETRWQKARRERKEARQQKKEALSHNNDEEVVFINYDSRAPGGVSEKEFQKIKDLYREESEEDHKHGKKIRVVFDDRITQIPDHSMYQGSDHPFERIGRVTSVTLPKSLVSIGDQFMERASNVEEIIVPNGVQAIGKRFFFGGSKIKKVELPEGLKTIGGLFLCNASELETIHFPDSLESVGCGLLSGASVKEADLSHTKVKELILVMPVSGKIKVPEDCHCEMGYVEMGIVEDQAMLDRVEAVKKLIADPSADLSEIHSCFVKIKGCDPKLAINLSMSRRAAELIELTQPGLAVALDGVGSLGLTNIDDVLAWNLKDHINHRQEMVDEAKEKELEDKKRFRVLAIAQHRYEAKYSGMRDGKAYRIPLRDGKHQMLRAGDFMESLKQGESFYYVLVPEDEIERLSYELRGDGKLPFLDTRYRNRKRRSTWGGNASTCRSTKVTSITRSTKT